MLINFLQESRKYSAEYNDKLSNHLPMALIALDRIGASSEQLQKFYDKYCSRLSLQTSSATLITKNNWDSFLGQHIYNSEYRDYFLKEIETKGKKQTLFEYLPKLISGLSGGAFHPLIRLAYALEVENDWEIAESLASWCIAYQSLGEIKQTDNKESDLTLILEKISQDKINKSANISGPNIFVRMQQATMILNINQLVAQTEINQSSLKDIANISLKIYGDSDDDFTALHCVTTAHAARIILPFIENSESFLQYLWQGITAAYATIDSLEQPHSKSEEFTWEQIFSKARTSLNDHVIKFCYTAHQEELYYNNSNYKNLAAIKAGL
jgi:hypothetical protein